MADQYTSYKAFISSPGDVAAERQLAEEVIQCINRSCSETLSASIMVKKWEDQPPETPHLPEEKIQDMINKEVEKAQFFILILYKRYGSIEPGHTKSNTERELETILKRYETHPEIKIMAYFREIPSDPDPGDQKKQVLEFRARLTQMGIRYKIYKDPLEFKDAFTHDMYNVLLRIRLASFKQTALRRFWKIGHAERQVKPRVAIIFPSVRRNYINPNSDDLWLNRLEPTVYYEDFRAIHKIQKTLSLIGMHDHKAFFSANIPKDTRYMNRVWICFPRSTTALNCLQKYTTRAQFRFEPRENVASEVIWQNPRGEKFNIISPLATYLNEQRAQMKITGECNARMRDIVCKDFAIIARFKNDESAAVTNGDEFLYDYFFAGIRGLGTWGTGWYIDRCSKQFLKHPDDGDLQLLLEVTYENGGIADVIDVSDKPHDYFIEQNDLNYIRKRIQLFDEK